MTVKLKVSAAAALLLLLFGSFSQLTFAKSLVDSIGIDRKGEKVYVLHRVEPKQTLFSILKRYGSSLSEYRTENPNVAEAVKVDEVIRVPFHGKMPATHTVVAKTEIPSAPVGGSAEHTVVSESGIHKVVGKEGLYGLSLKYKVTMAEVRKWNGLTTDVLHEGQMLYMSEAAFERSKKTGTVSTQPAPTPVPTKPEPEKELPKPLPKPVEPEKVPEKEEAKPATPIIKNVVEKGIAEVIDVEDNSSKYLALHRSAAIGTMITVKNENNGQIVYVKVIGKLPEAAIAEHVIIRLSPKAFEKLSPNDPKKVRAEISYVAQ